MTPLARASVLLFASCILARPAGAQSMKGVVLGAGIPIAKSTVTLWEATAGAPNNLGKATTAADGKFEIHPTGVPTKGSVLYFVANGGVPGDRGADNPAIRLLAVVGTKPLTHVVINEFSTVASVWTGAQFLDGPEMRGNPLGLRIAAGNVPNFVDLETGGWGGAIQDPLNGPQTPTMANFATLADALAGCVVRVTRDACTQLLTAATPPTGVAPTTTLGAAEAIARNSWYKPERVSALLEAFYPTPTGKSVRPVPFMPYLQLAPSAWVLPLKFDGGGYRAGGKAMFDSEGNLWVGDNFTIGSQSQDAMWQGKASKFAPNGKPLSPITTGFAGGGMQGGTFGAAVDERDNAWFTSSGGQSITVFSEDGTPITPPEGITFGGRLGEMQGVIVAPNEDVWVLGATKSQLAYFPKGDIAKGRIVCEGDTQEPCKSFRGPFHLAIDQQDRIWVSNSFGDWVTRFPSSDPAKAQKFKSGFSGSGLAIDSKGDVWVTNRLGNSARGATAMESIDTTLRRGGDAGEAMIRSMSAQTGGADGGSVTLLQPDGSPYPGSPFSGGGLPAPWAAAVDGNDNVWISNFAAPNSPITQLCGARIENCPPGFKTGDPIAPPGGYVGGGLQMQTDLAIDPAGNVWVINNRQPIESCVHTPAEGAAAQCGGQGVTVFYGMAKPVDAPQIGPARAAR
jgi:hypothetical protein